MEEAVDLLDWLECHGVRNRELSYVEGVGFTVH